MSPSFARPIGAQADLNELEYISALHQTCKASLGSDGTISALDVSRFLKSRYGIVTSDEAILELVWGLGGGNPQVAVDTKNNDEPPDLDHIFLDLTQIITIITMPTIARAAHEWRLEREGGLRASAVAEEANAIEDSMMASIHNGAASSPYDLLAASHSNFDADEFVQHNFWSSTKTLEEQEAKDNANWRYSLRPMPKNMLKHVLRVLVAPLVEEEARSSDTTTATYEKDENGDFLLSFDLVRALLHVHGEEDRAGDDAMIEAMLNLAEGATVLNVETWVRLLSSDLDLWKVGSEDNHTTTEFFDVFQHESHYAAPAGARRTSGIVERKLGEW